MIYEPIIGLEVHLQLKTKTKMFAPEAISDNADANTFISPVSLGHPGTLPVPNERAIEMGLLVAVALKCKINTSSKFDRKNYFYPDLPKGYQISQFDLPIGKDGEIVIDCVINGKSEVKRIGIERIHLEEDAAKNIHSDEFEKTLIDYNRAGVPLIELVSKPDLRSPEEAKAYLQEVRLIARTLGVSDADMEKGQMRCDANISLRKLNDDGSINGEAFNPKTEIKNLNSFRMVERALKHEIERQTKLWESNTPPACTSTRGWNDKEGVTILQREKEESSDYRYFPDPDLPRLDLSEMTERIMNQIPELPAEKRKRFKNEFGMSDEDTRFIVENPNVANYTEELFSELHEWIDSQGNSKNSSKEMKQKSARLVGTWVINKWLGILNAKKLNVSERKITPENFAELIILLAEDAVTSANALKMLEIMTDTGADPNHVMEDGGFGKLQDESELAKIISRTLASHEAEVKRYLDGETKLLQFLMGVVMKETGGHADPGVVRNLISVELESRR